MKRICQGDITKAGISAAIITPPKLINKDNLRICHFIYRKCKNNVHNILNIQSQIISTTCSGSQFNDISGSTVSLQTNKVQYRS